MAVRVDHAVINVLTSMDEAVGRFRALGFQATERGWHTLGSINHLMMFPDDYLELVGIEAGAAKVREEVARGPAGLNGLVFATDDARALHRRLAARGVPVAEPVDFSRPVMVDGVERSARFTTVRVHADFVGSARVYYCQQHTPEWVWHAPWLDHPNTACGLAEVVIVADDPDAQARRYEQLLDGPRFEREGEGGDLAVSLDACRLSLVDPQRYAARLGAAASRRASTAPLDGGSCLGALSLRVDSLDAVRRHLAAAGLDGVDQGDLLTVPAPALWDCPVSFVAASAARAA
jgi:hypothetical protein